MCDERPPTSSDEPAPPSAGPRKRRLVANIGLFLAAVAVATVVSEIILRVCGVCSYHIVRDPNRGWRHRPGARVGEHRINALGFSGNGFPLAKIEGEVRILCMGDSCTFGENVAPDETYPAQLAARLTARLPTRRTRVINGGVNGYSSYQGLHWFRSVAQQLNPDVVTVFYGWNDHWLPRIGGPDKQMAGSPLEHVRCVLSRLRLFELGVLGWHALRKTANIPFLEGAKEETPATGKAVPAPKPERPLRVSLTDYEANLRQFVATSRSCNARVILLTAPNYLALANVQQLPASAFDVTDKTGVAELRALHESYSQVVRKVARGEGTPLVDLCKLFAQSADPAVNFATPPTDFIHPSAAGFEIVAKALSDAIVPLLDQRAAPAGKRP